MICLVCKNRDKKTELSIASFFISVRNSHALCSFCVCIQKSDTEGLLKSTFVGLTPCPGSQHMAYISCMY